MAQKLRIGDSSPNAQVTVVDEDRLCYLVKNDSKGAQGIRTISKKLLSEFVAYVRLNPQANANEARKALSGKSGIDKYEYGYDSTLLTMARMIIEKSDVDVDSTQYMEESIQLITYGAPGTGKSYAVKCETDEWDKKGRVVRTTFHPDSDYSTFVGCYKPTMRKTGVKNPIGNEEESIVYEFVPQAFLKAYINAWKDYPEPEFLVVEEINRGNCAQIFGDLFQLLDRNSEGMSEYPIDADNDLKRYIAEQGLTLEQCDLDDGIKESIKRGEKLLLPDNLYIRATMNTSDQSLFPIDSAFKRRWDWRYIPISKGVDSSGKALNWVIEADENKYDWWKFLQVINKNVFDTTNSEDKQLGFFFCKPKDGVIDAQTFVSKVIFYLWNDVFKDFGFDNEIFNDRKDEGEQNEKLSFDKFFLPDGRVDEKKVVTFLDNLKLSPVSNAGDVAETTEEETVAAE